MTAPTSEATILFLAANPALAASLSLGDAARDLERRIRPRSPSLSLRFRASPAVRREDVQQALDQLRPSVVHFRGGGGDEPPGVVMEDAASATMPAEGWALRLLFSAFKEHVRVVVLDACHSEEQAREIGKEIDCVVGLPGSLGAAAATQFAAAFYEALACGRGPGDAFECGVAALEPPRRGEEVPCLVVRSRAVASKVLLAPVPANEYGISILTRPDMVAPWAAVHDETITRQLDSLPRDEQGVEVPRLIVAFECRRPRVPGLCLSLADVDVVQIGRGPGRLWWRANRRLLLNVPGQEISRMHAKLTRNADGWNLSDLGSKNGTIVDGLRTEHCTLTDGDLIEIGGTLFVYRDRAEQRDGGDRDLAGEEDIPEVFRTLSIDLERRMSDLVRVAGAQVPVLVLGETGTGKELIARAVHAASRRKGPFVPVNCGALPRTLIESELFGHRKGAFSGAAADHVGLARKADGGTLFLDEVAELPEESQVALLRLLQEGEVRPVGSTDIVKVNVRVIAATHQDLPARIADGRFRSDLYARLDGYKVTLPPLRERPEDIGSIIAALLRRIAPDDAPLTFTPRAAFALFAYHYPMNVRELEQALGRAFPLAAGPEIDFDHLPPAICDYAKMVSRNVLSRNLRPEDVALRSRLIELFRQNHGNITATARALDKAPVQVRRWCRRLGIDVAEFRRA